MLKKLIKSKWFQLMIFEASFEPLSNETSFGGTPPYNDGENFVWPTCSNCDGHMQYLGKLADGDHLHLLFMCQNDPGCCDEWDPDEGGNRVITFKPKHLTNVPVPDSGETLRNTEYGCKIVKYRDLDYNEARANWANKTNNSFRMVLGMVDGDPYWLQGDETPTCSSCSKPMKFKALLEVGPEYKTEMNFGGGGCAYLFTCGPCESAKFLWQC
jgi:hypothetical protein